ncbi:AT-rich interactive domain-containing protein 1 [Helianthus annuus]|nr:AT-rich interactive domain-containing protein 1 [Helianthus annuus]XP_035830303.1 AT-rich interactive domain-containing protein 1 [Helianthus annuus]
MDMKLDLEKFFKNVDIGDESESVDLQKFFKDVDIVDESEFVDFKNVRAGNRCCVGEKHVGISESCVGIEEEKKVIKKRKKESCLPLLDWVKSVAKDPCDPVIGSLPESYKWKAYGSEHVWKQVLMAKEAMSLKVNVDVDPNAKRSIWQKKQKMHPDMYDDQSKKSYTRCSQRLIAIEENRSILLSRKPQVVDHAESSSSPVSDEEEDEDYLWCINYRKKRIPLGRFFQAEVPQWAGKTEASESKWLGTPVWPLKETENRTSLIEREPIGKGQQGSCGCQRIGSLECVRFHVAEKRRRLKRELGSAFAKWKFDMMGEEVSLRWTKNEEKKFASIIKSNPESSGRCFWDVLVAYFKNKTRAVLVSYYFSVYLFRRRAHQNRADPSNVNSDDDELESTESILCSPNVHLKFTKTF